MNIRVLLCTAGIAAVQSFVGNRIDSRQQPAGSRGGIRQNAGRVPRTGQGRNEMPVGFPRNANLSEELPVEYFIPDSSHMDILCGREGRNRYYYRQGSDSLWCVGHENATFYIDYARPELLLRYPFAYGDSLTSRFEGAGRYGQRIPLFRRGERRLSQPMPKVN